MRAAVLLSFLRRLQRFSTIGHPKALVACLALSAAEGYVAPWSLPRPDLHRLADDSLSGHTSEWLGVLPPETSCNCSLHRLSQHRQTLQDGRYLAQPQHSFPMTITESFAAYTAGQHCLDLFQRGPLNEAIILQHPACRSRFVLIVAPTGLTSQSEELQHVISVDGMGQGDRPILRFLASDPLPDKLPFWRVEYRQELEQFINLLASDRFTVHCTLSAARLTIRIHVARSRHIIHVELSLLLRLYSNLEVEARCLLGAHSPSGH